jgi:hypothetical protein
MTYANVVATLALVFAMAGGAAAASHYLITSTKQISPKVLKQLKKPGAKGTTGPAGPAGPAGAAAANGSAGAAGKEGPQGAQGPEGQLSGNTPRWHMNSEAGTEGSPVRTVLFKSAPFEIVGKCFAKEGETHAETVLTLSSGSGFFSEPGESEGTAFKAGEEPELVEPAVEEAGEPFYAGGTEGMFSAYVPSGEHSINGAANNGTSLEGKAKPACYFSGFAVAG